MSILIAVLASLGAAVVVLVVAFLAMTFVFGKAFSSDEGLGVVWLAGVGALICSVSTFAGGITLAVAA